MGVLTANQNYLFMFAPRRWRETEIIGSLHGTLWPKFGRVSWICNRFRWLNARMIFRHAATIQCVSGDIRDQIAATVRALVHRINVFRPTYTPGQSDGFRPADFAVQNPFRILFVGRIEANKEPFDLLAAGSKLRANHAMPDFRIDFCGHGSDLSSPRTAITAEGLANRCCVP